MAALPMTKLRHLARLYQQGIAGAEEQLSRIASTDVVEQTLGIKGPVNVEALVRAIEEYGARQRHDKLAECRQVSAHIAEKLAETARFNPKKKRIDIDLNLLSELARTGGYPYLGIDTGRRVRVLPHLGLLRELFRRCQGVKVESLFTMGDHLWLYYATDKGRGHFHLRVEQLRRDHQDVLVVKVPLKPIRVPPPEVPEPADSDPPEAQMAPETEPEEESIQPRHQEIPQGSKKPDTPLPRPDKPAGFRAFLDRV